MKKLILFSVSLLLAGLTLIGQEQNVLLTIDENTEVTLDAYKWMYQKNNEEPSNQNPESYLETFIDFKLKVKDAVVLGLDSNSNFKKELETYREVLVDSYIPHRISEEELVLEAYERSKVDVNASQILLTLPQNASLEDTLRVYEKMVEIRKEILGGSNFEEVARVYSEDQAVKVNGGHLAWVTVFAMPYPLETALYSTPVNELSMPVRSIYGYHLVKVHSRRTSPGLVRLANIYYKSTPDMSPEAQKNAKIKIWQAYDSLNMGVDFNKLAMNYSEDQRYAQEGGEMPWLRVGEMIPNFEKAAFKLKTPGEITQPVKTMYGWHIIKLLEKKSIGSYKEMKPWLEGQVQGEKRLEYHQEKYEKRLIAAYGFKEFPSVLELVYAEVDSSLLAGVWDGANLQTLSTPLLEIGDKAIPVGKFVSFVVEKQDAGRRARNARFYINELYEQYKPVALYAYQEFRVPLDFPEFKYELQEFHDGLLLFEIMDQKVWSKAVTDVDGLESFFESHRDRYMWEERTDAYIITCKEGADIEKLRKKYKKISSGSLDVAALNEKFCDQDSSTCINLARVFTEKGVYSRVDALNGVPGPGPVYENSTSKGFVIINEVRPPEPKQLDEARGDVVSDYQKYLEKTWLEEIRQKYPVQVNRDLLKQMAP